MKPTKTLLASIFLTVIFLVVVGAVANNVMANNNKSANPNASAETIQVYQKREVYYNQLIQQANRQIEEANAKLQAMQNQAAQAPQTTLQTAAAAPSTAISADHAEQIARQAAAPDQLLQKKAELVNFEGKVAYEVAFSKGSIYIDAQSGEVLFNGTVPQTITAEKAAQIAADYLKNSDIVQVDQITFRNASLYRVIFKNGMMVYMDLTGQITYILRSSPKVVTIDTPGYSHPNSGSGQPSSGGGGGYVDDGGYEGGDH